jgi:hypothetical protein
MLNTYLYKKASKTTGDIAEAVTDNPLTRAFWGGLTGSISAAEAGAMYRNDENNLANGKLAILNVLSDEEVRKDAIIGLGLGAGRGMTAGTKGTAAVAGLGWGTLEPSLRNAASGLILQGVNSG